MTSRSGHLPKGNHRLRNSVLVVLSLLAVGVVPVAYRAVKQSWTVSRFRSIGLNVFYNVENARDAFSYGWDEQSDDSWKHVKGLLAPTAPNSDCKRIDDMRLEGLEDLDSIQVLGLSYCPISDTTMKRIGHLKHLTHLSLDGTRITNTGMDELKRLNNLKHLSLAFTKISDSGLRAVSQLPSLQWLDLTNTEITDAGLRQVCKMKSLRVLQLDMCEVTADGIAQLRCLDTLEALNLNRVSLHNKDVERLGELKSLRYLSVIDTGITEECLEKRLHKLIPNLKDVDLGDSTVFGGGMAGAEPMPPEYEGIDWSGWSTRKDGRLSPRTKKMPSEKIDD